MTDPSTSSLAGVVSPSPAGALPDAVVLLGRGGLGSAARLELQAAAEALQQRLGEGCRVVAAFVDRNAPALPEALDACAGAACVAVVPVMVPDEPSLRRWLHKVVLRWRARSQSTQRLYFAPPLLSAPGLPEVLAAQARQALLQPDVPAVAGDDDWERDPIAWSSVPGHRHHVLWCVGPRCAARGAVAMWPKLGEAVRSHPQLKQQVELLQTGCQYPCNHGPMMIVYPAGVWYGPLQAEDLPPVLLRHVAQGQFDAPQRFHGPMPPAAMAPDAGALPPGHAPSAA